MKVGCKAVAVWLESGAPFLQLIPISGVILTFLHGCLAPACSVPVLCAASAYTHTHTNTHVSLWSNVWSKIWVCGFDGTVGSVPEGDEFSPKFECTAVSWLLNTTCWWGVSWFLQRRQKLWKTEQLKGLNHTKRSWLFCGPFYPRS